MKKLKNLILTVVLMFIGISVVRAEYSITVDAATGSAGSGLSMTFNGIEDPETAHKNGEGYYVMFVNDETEKPTLTGSISDSGYKVDNGIKSFARVSIYLDEEKQNYQTPISIDYDWYLLDGYELAYVVKCASYDSCVVSDTPIKVERPELPELGQRYQNFLFTQDEYNSLSVFPYFPYLGDTGSHELNVKIGQITDQNLLKRLSRSEKGSLEDLLEYAKKNDGTVFTKKSDQDLESIDIGNFSITNGAYYYMYTYYTNTDGMYRNLDDITVAMGDLDMLVNDVEWKFEESEWEKFIEDYKNSEYLDDYSENEISYSSDDTKFIVTLSGEGNEYSVQFNYEDGIVSYEAKEFTSISDDLTHSFLIGIALNEFAQKFEYDFDTMMEFIKQNPNLEIEKDGFEYIVEKNEIEEVKDGATSKSNSERFKSLKFDLRNGLSTFIPNVASKSPETVDNPETGINLGFGILALIAILCTGVYLVIRKNSKFPKHN